VCHYLCSEPPGKWTICPLPDSADKNEGDAEFISQCLNGMEINTFIGKNPNEHRTVTKATSQAERHDILKSKFIFDWASMPRVGNVLLFDDRVSSGDTLDWVVASIRNHLTVPMEIAALTKFVYIGSKATAPEVRKLTAAVKDDGMIEQSAQK